MRLNVKKEFSGHPFPNINVGNVLEGIWTSPHLCYNLDMEGDEVKLGSLKDFCS